MARPKIQLEKTVIDIKWERLALMAGVLMILLPALYWNQMPESVPIHFNGKGEADGFGPKWQIFILPIIAVVTGVFMYFISLFPHTFSYKEEVTQENAAELYQRSARMIRIVNALTMVFMAFLTFIILQSALNQKWSNGVAFWIAIGAYTLSVMYIAFTAMKKK